MLFQSQIDTILTWLPIWHRKKAKQTMRGLLEQQRRILPKQEMQELSEAILQQLYQTPEWQKAKVVLCYYPIHNEVNLRPLLEQFAAEKTLLLPVAHRHTLELRVYQGHDNLRRGRFGIPEPQGNEYSGKFDLILVPGVGFDRQLHRLGRGGGYYDRFLKKFPFVHKIGLAYDFQMVKEVPCTIFDQKVNKIITPTHVFS